MTFRLISDPWNELHDIMELHHDHFRHTFSEIYSKCDSVTSTSDADGASELNDLLTYANGLYRHLDAHHSIEE